MANRKRWGILPHESGTQPSILRPSAEFAELYTEGLEALEPAAAARAVLRASSSTDCEAQDSETQSFASTLKDITLRHAA